MLDLTETAKTDNQKIAERLVELVNEAIVKDEEARRAERYKDRPKSLGGGSIGFPGAKWGDVCERALFYEYKQYPQDEGKGFGGDLYRIFGMGHDAEERIAQYLRLAGFNLLTEKANGGGQFGFEKLPDPETGIPRMRGFADGVFIDGPSELAGQTLVYPFLWECKALNDKKWKEMVSKGVMKSHPKYYAQVQLYMGVLNLTQSPALITAMNRNTGELHYEFVQYNEAHAQQVIDRGIRVVSTKHPLELPRINNDWTQVPCTWCAYRSTCKKQEEERAERATENQPKFWSE